MTTKIARTAQYASIIVNIFQKHWKKGMEEFEFHRDEMVEAAAATAVDRPDNLGDVIYSFKFRKTLPAAILTTAPKGKSWILEGAGSSRYRFRLVKLGGTSFKPREDIAAIKIPDATPEIIGAYALGDEQALLAKVRYNRLIDIFLGLTTYSLQNHLRTQVKGMGHRSRSMRYTSASTRTAPSLSFRYRQKAGRISYRQSRPFRTKHAAESSSQTSFAGPYPPSSWTMMSSHSLN
jgi:hypothetical protein